MPGRSQGDDARSTHARRRHIGTLQEQYPGARAMNADAIDIGIRQRASTVERQSPASYPYCGLKPSFAIATLYPQYLSREFQAWVCASIFSPARSRRTSVLASISKQSAKQRLINSRERDVFMQFVIFIIILSPMRYRSCIRIWEGTRGWGLGKTTPRVSNAPPCAGKQSFNRFSWFFFAGQGTVLPGRYYAPKIRET